MFPSHYGLILTIAIETVRLAMYSVSIPLWSDFNIVVLIVYKVIGCKFPSHYGPILTGFG